MAYTKRTWLGRQGTGLNKFSIGGATPVTIVNQPDSVTQVGDALSAGNLNDLEDRIEDAFDDVDTELATKADEQDVTNLNNAISALDHRVTNLELKTGDQFDVDYPSSTYGMDGVPSNVEPYAEVSGLKGVGRVANQCIHDITSALQTANATINSFADGVTTFTVTAQRGCVYSSRNINPLPQKDGHYVLIFMDVKTSTATDDVRLYCYGGYAAKNIVASTNWQQVAVVVKVLASWGYDFNYQNYMTLEDTRSGNWDAIQTRNWKCRDLTEYFNATDLSFLGATNAEKLVTIQQKYPWLLEPSDYGTQAVFPIYTSVKSVGFNKYDASIASIVNSKYIAWQTGAIVSWGSGWNIDETYHPIVGGKEYELYFDSSPVGGLTEGGFAFYDADKNYIGGVGLNATPTKSYVFTTPNNARFIRITTGSADNTPDKICLHFNGVNNGTVQPYMTDTFTLPEPVTLKGAGSVSEDYYPETGRVTHPIGSYTFDGTESWGLSGGYFQWNGLNNVIKRPSSGTEVPNLLIIGFLPCHWNKTEEKAIYVVPSAQSLSNYIWIKDSSFADVASLKAFLTGKTLYYELATPAPDTYVDPIIDPYVEVEPNGTVEAVQSQSPEVDSAMMIEYMAS